MNFDNTVGAVGFVPVYLTNLLTLGTIEVFAVFGSVYLLILGTHKEKVLFVPVYLTNLLTLGTLEIYAVKLG